MHIIKHVLLKQKGTTTQNVHNLGVSRRIRNHAFPVYKGKLVDKIISEHIVATKHTVICSNATRVKKKEVLLLYLEADGAIIV